MSALWPYYGPLVGAHLRPAMGKLGMYGNTTKTLPRGVDTTELSVSNTIYDTAYTRSSSVGNPATDAYLNHRLQSLMPENVSNAMNIMFGNIPLQAPLAKWNPFGLGVIVLNRMGAY